MHKNEIWEMGSAIYAGLNMKKTYEILTITVDFVKTGGNVIVI